MAHGTPDPGTLATWDATETRERIRAKDVSAAEVVEAAIARAEAAGQLGAIVTPLFEEARSQVASAGRDGAERPLFGVPTFVKDLARVRGARIAWGSRASGEYVAKKTDRIARRIADTGMITLGKSATPELGLTATTEPVGWDPCRNPWDLSRSAGGSSGGAGALVAADVVPIAHGSDGGGSIRIPASCCGLVGLKPSRFRLDLDGSGTLPVNIACDGVVTRTVRDTIAFFEAIETRRRPKRVPPIGPVAERPEGRLRLGVFVDAPTGTPVAADVKAAVRDAAALCRSLGHDAEEIACPIDGSVIDDFLRYWGFVAWIQVAMRRFVYHWGFDRSRLEPWTVGLGRWFVREKGAAWRAIGRLRAFSRSVAQWMGPYDVLVSPTLAEPAPAIGYLATDLEFETVFSRVRAYAPFTPAYNAAGLPAIALPLGRSAEGLPIGVQFAAGHGCDRTLLELALALEAAKPWPRLAPRGSR